MTRLTFWVSVALAAAACLFCAFAWAEDRPLVLEMILNGRATGILGNFADRDGVLYATPAELSDLGFRVPDAMSESAEPVAVNKLPGVEATVNQRSQTIVINATDAALRPQQLNGPRDFRQNASITPPMVGLALNYSILETESEGKISGGGQIDARFFSRFGTVATTGYGLFAPAPGQSPVIRLDTNWAYAQPDSLRRFIVGDFVTGALGSSRPVRLGGFKIASDFGLRPDLVTFPLPQLSGSTAVPTTVDVLVNGVRQMSQPVTPGPFEIRSLPIVTGAGEVAIAYQDALGRQTITTVPFYASSALLQPGLTAYSLEAGFIREGYSQVSNQYGQGAMVGTVRRGVSDWITLESHGEITSTLAMASVGGNIRVGALGVVSFTEAGSTSAAGSGWTTSASAERNAGVYSLAMAASLASDEYRDIAGLQGATLPRTSYRISGGIQLGSLGSIGAAYIRQQPFGAREGSPAAGSANISLVTMTYQAQLAERINFYTTGYANLRGQDPVTGKPATAYGAMVGLSIFFGNSYSIGVSASSDFHHPSYLVDAAKAANDTGEYGVRLTDSEGFAQRRLGEFEYNDAAGVATLGVDQSGQSIATRAGFSGSLVAAAGGVFAGKSIPDSFAIVRTGDVADVGVSYENRPIGRTDSSGRLLVPDLRAYQVNRITLNATDLPPDVTAGKTDMYVRPPERSGVLVDFNVRGSNAALLRLTDGGDHPLPVGTIVLHQGADLAVVGYDGEVYLTDLDARNDFELQLPDGAHCGVSFAYKHVAGELPVIGPIRCH